MDRSLDLLLQDLQLPGHRALAEHWLGLQRAAGGIPPLAAVDPLQFAKALADAWIVDAEADGRFRIRLMGETLVQWYGRSMKGLYYDDMFSAAILPVVTEQSRQVIDRPCIGYHRMRTTIPDWTVPAAFERLALPLLGADGQVGHILGATLFHDRASLAHGRGGASTSLDVDYWYPLTPDTAL
jgi:hypothetical protein